MLAAGLGLFHHLAGCWSQLVHEDAGSWFRDVERLIVTEHVTHVLHDVLIGELAQQDPLMSHLTYVQIRQTAATQVPIKSAASAQP